MKIKLILAILSLSILTTGCGLGKDSQTVEQGKEALESHKYEEAINLFTTALDENSSDEHARAMYKQARGLLNVDKYEKEGNLEKAIKELKTIEEVKGGSSIIKSEATSKRKELESLNEEQNKAEIQRKEEAKDAASKDKYRLEKEALEAQRKEEEKKKEEEEALKQEQENQQQGLPNDGETTETQQPTNPITPNASVNNIVDSAAKK